MAENELQSARVFRAAGLVLAGYVLALALMDAFIYHWQLIPPLLRYHVLNAAPAIVFCALAFSPLQQKYPKPARVLLIALATLAPVAISQLFGAPLPDAPLANIEGAFFRQLPILMVGVILIAWHYPARITLLCVGGLGLAQMILLNARPALAQEHALAFYFSIVIQSIALSVTGIFISQLITWLKAEQNALKAANDQLAHHASALETLTVSRERNRLARELHDTLAHTLSGQAVNLEAIKLSLAPEQGDVAAMLDGALATTRDGLTDVRRAIRDLRSQPLDDLGLGLALRQMALEASARGSFVIDLDIVEPVPPLEPEIEHAFYRIAQESLENVAKHANARRVALRLARERDDLCLTISDDGEGTDLSQVDFDNRLGLIGMQERAALVSGKLAVDSRLDHGTTVRFAWTVPHD